jgi:hypothetical protein
MKKLHILGLALVAMFAFAAVAAGSASATEWLVSGAAAPAGSATTSTGSIELEDMTLGASVKCTTTTDEGTVGAGAADTVTKVTFAGCTSPKGCTSVDNVEAIHLPWTTTASGTAPSFKDTISEKGTGGAPGYLIECVSAGLLLDDSCTKATANVEVKNLTSSVEALFNTEEEAKCSLGGEKAGLVHGSEVISATGGLTLALN